MARLNLPSPRRTVRRGVRLCNRLGYTDREGLVLIMAVAASASRDIMLLGEYDTAWVDDVYREAQGQLATRYPQATLPTRGQGQGKETGI